MDDNASRKIILLLLYPIFYFNFQIFSKELKKKINLTVDFTVTINFKSNKFNPFILRFIFFKEKIGSRITGWSLLFSQNCHLKNRTVIKHTQPFHKVNILKIIYLYIFPFVSF